MQMLILFIAVNIIHVHLSSVLVKMFGINRQEYGLDPCLDPYHVSLILEIQSLAALCTCNVVIRPPSHSR